MLLLAVDTSGKRGSIALARGQDDGSCELIESVPLEGGTFSAQLVPQIAALLARQGFKKEQIGGFAVASGPGSFTGLRVGLAAVKGLAEVLQKPVATVSLLEAVASAPSIGGSVWAALDAGRQQAYLGHYALETEGTVCDEQLVGFDEIGGKVCGRLITPDDSVAAAARAGGIEIEQITYPGSEAIARLGWAKLRAGQVVSPESLEANYIRRSDAEIFSKP